MEKNKNKIYLGNAFSIQMISGLLDKGCVITPEISEITTEAISHVLRNNDFTSCIGHTDTANIMSSILGLKVESQRINVSLEQGDIIYVCQVVGGRLPEGCTELPEGVTLKWYSVEI